MAPFDKAHMTSSERFIPTIGLSCTVSEIDGDFSRKSQKKIPTPCILRPTEAVPWELGMDDRDPKTRIMGLPGRENSLTISSGVWTQYVVYCDGRTDGQTSGDSKDRAYA